MSHGDLLRNHHDQLQGTGFTNSCLGSVSRNCRNDLFMNFHYARKPLISQLHKQFQLLDRIRNGLIHLAIATHEDCDFRFQNWRWDGKSCRKSEWNLFLFSLQSFIETSFPFVFTIELQIVSTIYRTHSPISLTRMLFLMSIRNYKPCLNTTQVYVSN